MRDFLKSIKDDLEMFPADVNVEITVIRKDLQELVDRYEILHGKRTNAIQSKKKLLEIYDLAFENPAQAQNIIEKQIEEPYDRAQSNNIDRRYIVNLLDNHVENYYKDLLYKLWNLAEMMKS